jgi:two-component system, cell cycle sensor histidine kinase and response regulator CckA
MVRFHNLTLKHNWFSHLFGQTRKSSLFLILVIPFVVQIVTIVGLTSYVSYKSGQNAVNDLANQLMTEIGKRIDQNLSSYIEDIEKITRTNASLVRSGALDPGDQVALRQHFWEQLHNYELASTVALGTEHRDFMALERDNISFILREYDKKTRRYTSYRLNNNGEKVSISGVIENYDPLNDPPHDPWYVRTKTRGMSTWLLVVTMAKGPEDPELMMVNFLPIYDKQKKMLGVAASSIYISQFGRFLTSLKIGKSGQVFVIDKQGNLIATSTGEIPFRQKKGATYPETLITESRRIAALESKNPLTAAGMKAIMSEYGNLGRLPQPRQFSFDQAGAHYLLKIVPINQANQDWLTVIIVPETDFMGHINHNARQTLLFSILALLVAIIIGIFTVRWVTAPILRLNAAAKKMAKGEWANPVDSDRSDEIGELASTFNAMAEKLKTSFERLQEDAAERERMAAEIRASEERFRYLLQNVPAIAIQGYRLDGTTTYWNQASERLYGYAAEEAVGRSLLELIIPPEMRREVQESMEQMARTGRPIPSAELSLRRRDGTRVAVFSNHALVKLPSSDPELFCLDVDLSERKKVEEQLLFSEFTIEHSEVATFWLDRRSRVVRVNEAACRSLGYSREELLQMSVYDFDPDFRAGDKWDQDWEQMQLNHYGAIETRHQRKDGTIFPVSVVSSSFAYSGEDYTVAFVQDITARKQAEEEILREREKLKTLSDNAPFGMALISKEGYFTYINPRITELFGYNLSDIPDGRTWFRKAYPNEAYRHTVISNWQEDLRDARPGEQKPRVFNVTCKDGLQKIIQFVSSVLVSGSYVMTCEDITKMTQIQTQLQQAQKMEAIGTLAGGIAHDFNNILTALMGYAQLMKMTMDDSDPSSAYVDQILFASRKAADLTKGLLTFSRQQEVTFMPLDINKTIRETEKLLKRLLTEDIAFHTFLTEEDVTVMSDKSQMDQIFFNLIANARDAMPKGGMLTIETDIAVMDENFVETYGFGKPGRYVLIKISDTGMGMNETTREKIFDPFFTTKELGKGTGLGLATVYGIIKQHNGYITLKSEPSRGTIFYIYLPAIGSQIKDGPETSMPIASGKETILIAEDDPGVMQFMREVLQRYGYQIIEAINGEDAVEKYINNRDVDLIILDSVMPKKNGREVYEEIYRINPHIKVLFTSGYTKDIILEKGIEDKVFNFIAKPLSLHKLLQKIRDILDS